MERELNTAAAPIEIYEVREHGTGETTWKQTWGTDYSDAAKWFAAFGNIIGTTTTDGDRKVMVDVYRPGIPGIRRFEVWGEHVPQYQAVEIGG